MIFTPEQIEVIHEYLAEVLADFSKEDIIDMFLGEMPTEQLLYMYQNLTGLEDLSSEEVLDGLVKVRKI